LGLIELPPPLIDVALSRYLPIDKRDVGVTRVALVVDETGRNAAARPPELDATRTEPPRNAPDEDADAVVAVGADAADAALVYVPVPPSERTDAAPYASGAAHANTAHNIEIVDTFNVCFITLSTLSVRTVQLT